MKLTENFFLCFRDNDDETSVLDAVKKLNEVKCMRGLGRYFKQVGIKLSYECSKLYFEQIIFDLVL
jgi:hypothetical protein